MKSLTVTSLFFFLSHFSIAQGWFKTYFEAGPEDYFPTEVSVLPNQKIVLAGAFESSDFAEDEIRFLELAPDGEMEQGHTPFETPFLSDRVGDLLSAQDGGLLVAGSANAIPEGNGYAYVKKLNDEFEEEWCTELHSFGADFMYKIMEVPNGEIIVLGALGNGFNIQNLPGGVQQITALQDLFVIRLSAAGDFLWEYVLEEEYDSAWPHSGTLLDDGSVIVSASTVVYDVVEIYDKLLFKLNENGEEQWMQVYANDEIGHSFKPINISGTGLFAVSDRIVSDTSFTTETLLFELSDEGEILSEKTIDLGERQTVRQAILSPEGNIILGGGIEMNPADERDPFLAAISTNGDIEWLEHFPVPEKSAILRDIVLSPSGEIFGTGSVWNAEDFRRYGFALKSGAVFSSAKEVFEADLSVGLFPNLITDDAFFEIKNGDGLWPLTMAVFHVSGRLVRTEEVQSGHHVFERNGLPGGQYFYAFSKNGRALYSGKMMLKN